MRKKLIAGNWKMNGSLVKNRGLLEVILPALVGISCDVVVFPPFPYLLQARELLGGSEVAIGAQNVSEYESGAYTGEVSATMLVDAGAQYVLVGHSERRTLFGDSSSVLVKKVLMSVKAGLIPVFCVGETLIDRQADNQFDVVKGQLSDFFAVVNELGLSDLVVAYEPVWAIGTGVVATAAQAQEMHAVIRECISLTFGSSMGSRLLYGGSVKPDSARELLSMQDIDGLLVGGASLSAFDFVEICQAAI